MQAFNVAFSVVCIEYATSQPRRIPVGADASSPTLCVHGWSYTNAAAIRGWASRLQLSFNRPNVIESRALSDDRDTRTFSLFLLCSQSLHYIRCFAVADYHRGFAEHRRRAKAILLSGPAGPAEQPSLAAVTSVTSATQRGKARQPEVHFAFILVLSSLSPVLSSSDSETTVSVVTGCASYASLLAEIMLPNV